MSRTRAILFVNRDPAHLESLTAAIRQNGFLVYTAADMRGALSVLSANAIEVILCDNTLADVTGYDLLRFLKNDPLREKIPVIFFVPLEDQGRPVTALNLGASDFIVYPVKLETLLGRVDEVVSRPKSGRGDSRLPETAADSGLPSARERRQSDRIEILGAIRVEASRNGVLWLPAQIKNVGRQGMFLETALLGKAGLEIYVKVALPSGVSILKGQVKHIAFKNLNPSAGIGVEVEPSPEWRAVLQHVVDTVNQARDRSSDVLLGPPPGAPDARATAAAPADGPAPPPGPPEIRSSASYDVRFYQSLVGKQLDNYKAVSFLGCGAMGGVFEGWDIALERKVALKVISYRLAAKERPREMFIKEARFISRLDHPNIARIINIGTFDDILYFAMEFIDGVTMADMIRQGDKFNTLKGLHYLITICEALDFVSQNNIIHRDIKPANIMVDRAGRVKIVDFGVAKIADVGSGAEEPEGLVGSPYYISPEAIRAEPLDRRSDIYSLGATYYHGLTGSPPFAGKNAAEVLKRHLHQALVPLRNKNPKVSAALGRVIERMLAKSSEDRYPDYGEIIKDLRSLESRAQTFQKLKNATLIFRVKPKVAAER